MDNDIKEEREFKAYLKKDSELSAYFEAHEDDYPEYKDLKQYYAFKNYYDDIYRTLGDDTVSSGLFSGAQIHYYLKKYNIVIGYREKLIKNATYEMRLGRKAIRWQDKEKIEFDVKKNNELVLAPNSLTFVTTVEKFNLPADIIARFNLKSKYVHKGLLLGTGPIVDPEFQSRIVIPLHNFSTLPVPIPYGTPFISVEFTKCLECEPQYAKKIGYRYKKNEHSKISESEFFGKTFLVESSVLQTLDESKKVKEEIKNTLEKFKTISYITIAGVVIAIFTLMFMMFQSLSSAETNAQNAVKQVELLQGEIEKLVQNPTK